MRGWKVRYRWHILIRGILEVVNHASKRGLIVLIRVEIVIVVVIVGMTVLNELWRRVGSE